MGDMGGDFTTYVRLAQIEPALLPFGNVLVGGLAVALLVTDSVFVSVGRYGVCDYFENPDTPVSF